VGGARGRRFGDCACEGAGRAGCVRGSPAVCPLRWD
jgi:hypothetical protein